jgi:hypothetical protein
LQAIDDDCNQTGQMLAGLLNWPQGTFASKVCFLLLLPLLFTAVMIALACKWGAKSMAQQAGLGLSF